MDHDDECQHIALKHLASSSKMRAMTFVKLVTWRKAVCGNGKWVEHYLVLEEKHSIRY